MKKLNLKRAALATIIVWTLGVTAFMTSYYIPLMDDLDAQANWVLSIALLPATVIGARYYYLKGNSTNGLLVGACMFLLTVFLDASITVPIFIYPIGGDHISFFCDPGFWILGLEYVCVVSIYWILRISKIFRKRT